MGKTTQMIVVLVGICLISGLLLGWVNALTIKDIQDNELRYKKIPAVVAIAEGVVGVMDDAARAALADELLKDRLELTIPAAAGGAAEKAMLYVIKRDGKPHSIVLENSGQGYGGAVGVMLGFELATGNLAGLGVTTHSETPGVGSRVTQPAFRAQFKGMKGDAVLKVRKDGGDIDAISGATLSSRAVAAACQNARDFKQQYQAQIDAALAGGGAAAGGAQ